jgi:hypothetical protein
MRIRESWLSFFCACVFYHALCVLEGDDPTERQPAGSFILLFSGGNSSFYRLSLRYHHSEILPVSSISRLLVGFPGSGLHGDSWTLTGRTLHSAIPEDNTPLLGHGSKTFVAINMPFSLAHAFTHGTASDCVHPRKQLHQRGIEDVEGHCRSQQ